MRSEALGTVRDNIYMSTQSNMPRFTNALALEFPMSLAVFEKYPDAQKAVDYLADHEFPVQNCMIVGTELKQVERVTGRLTWGRIAIGGVLSGVWLGLFIGLIFALFGTGNTVSLIVSTALFGAVFGLVWAMIAHAATSGQRDFTSISQVVATKYEVLVEHKFAQQGRELLAKMPGAPSPFTG